MCHLELLTMFKVSSWFLWTCVGYNLLFEVSRNEKLSFPSIPKLVGTHCVYVLNSNKLDQMLKERKICFEMCLKLLHLSHFIQDFTKSDLMIQPEFPVFCKIKLVLWIKNTSQPFNVLFLKLSFGIVLRGQRIFQLSRAQF